MDDYIGWWDRDGKTLLPSTINGSHTGNGNGFTFGNDWGAGRGAGEMFGYRDGTDWGDGWGQSMLKRFAHG